MFEVGLQSFHTCIISQISKKEMRKCLLFHKCFLRFVLKPFHDFSITALYILDDHKSDDLP